MQRKVTAPATPLMAWPRALASVVAMLNPLAFSAKNLTNRLATVVMAGAKPATNWLINP